MNTPPGEVGVMTEEFLPSYTANPPDITAAFSNLSLERTTSKPTTDQCIAHLKLLEAFCQLREDVGNTDGLYGIKDEFVSSMASDRNKEALAKMREKRWCIYVTQAVRRFEAYWHKCLQKDAGIIRQTDLQLPYMDNLLKEQGVLKFTKDHLPPLGERVNWVLFITDTRQTSFWFGTHIC